MGIKDGENFVLPLALCLDALNNMVDVRLNLSERTIDLTSPVDRAYMVELLHAVYDVYTCRLGPSAELTIPAIAKVMDGSIDAMHDKMHVAPCRTKLRPRSVVACPMAK
jgi:hypothetical protein